MKNIKQSKLILLKVVFTFLLFTNYIYSQKIEDKGIVKGETETKAEPLNGVNIYLSDKSEITTSNKKGEFIFPRTLKIGDVLVFSYLGYLKKEIKITEKSSNLVVILKEDDNEMLGAVSKSKRFKSKKKAY